MYGSISYSDDLVIVDCLHLKTLGNSVDIAIGLHLFTVYYNLSIFRAQGVL